jgi:hypothetical protein
MKVTDKFKELVNNQDKLGIKIALKDAMLVDPTLDYFEELLSYVSDQGIEIFEEHDGEEFRPIDQWNEDYMHDELINLIDNFSRERVSKLRQAVPKVLKTEKGSEDNHSLQAQPQPQSQQERKISHKELGIGLTVGGVVIAGFGLATTHLVVAGLGVVTAGIGVGLIVTDK